MKTLQLPKELNNKRLNSNIILWSSGVDIISEQGGGNQV